jgi:imidazolonepropionase-like amidohydrolase
MHTLLGWFALTLASGAASPAVAAEPAVGAFGYSSSQPSAAVVGDHPESAAKSAPSETIFIHAEHVITQPGRVIDGASVLVRNGKVIAVGKDLTKPDGAREIEGKYVCAGFIDPWGAIGLGFDSIGEAGATPATRSKDGYDAFNFDHLRKDALRAGVTSARLQVGNTARIGGLGTLVRIRPGASREDVILNADCNLWMTIGLSQGGQMSFDSQGEVSFGSRAVDPFERIESVDRLVSQLQAGKNYLVQKNEYKHDLEAWQKTITEKETELDKDFKKAKKDREKAEKDATEKGKKFEEKKYKEDKKPTAPRIDEDSEVLARVANGEIPLIVFVNRVAEIRALLQATEGLERLRLIIAGGSEAPYFAKQLAERHIPVLLWPAPMGRNRPDEFDGNDLSLAARLSHEGVAVLLGSGGLDPAASRDLPLLAGLAIGNGLDREKAFEALTIGAARALDVADRLGSVESGKDADLIVLDGEPLVSTSHVRWVITGGQVVVTPED